MSRTNVFYLMAAMAVATVFQCEAHPYPATASDDVTEIRAVQTITVTNGRKFGNWNVSDELCQASNKAVGFYLKVESPQGDKVDDTALNGITLICEDNSIVTSSQGQWGNFTAPQRCPANSYLMAFRLRVETLFAQIGDDTTANDIDFVCTDAARTVFYGKSPTPWGTWGGWSSECPNGIRGINVRVEPPQGSGDDTALNDVRFICA